MANLFRVGDKIINLDQVWTVKYTPLARSEIRSPTLLIYPSQGDDSDSVFMKGNEADAAWNRLCAISELDETKRSLCGV